MKITTPEPLCKYNNNIEIDLIKSRFRCMHGTQKPPDLCRRAFGYFPCAIAENKIFYEAVFVGVSVGVSFSRARKKKTAARIAKMPMADKRIFLGVIMEVAAAVAGKAALAE